MALNFSTLTKPVNDQVIDPSTGMMRDEWKFYFQGLTSQLNASVETLSSDKAPADAQYLVGASHADLSAERVVASSTSITANLATPGAATFERAALTGDVTAPANSNATTIAADAVTFAKMQDISTDRLLGRDTAATGNVEEIAVGHGLTFDGAGIVGIIDDGVTNAKLANMATLTVKGRTAAGTGDPSDLPITAVGAMALVSSTNLASAANQDIALAGYDAYSIHILNMLFATDNNQLHIRFSDDNGATFEAGASDYAWSQMTTIATTGAVESDDADSEIQIGRTGAGNGIGNAAGEYLTLVMDIVPAAGARPKGLHWRGHYKDPSTRMCQTLGSGVFTGNTNPINYMRMFAAAGGNITAGGVFVFGYRYT